MLSDFTMQYEDSSSTSTEEEEEDKKDYWVDQVQSRHGMDWIDLMNRDKNIAADYGTGRTLRRMTTTSNK